MASTVPSRPPPTRAGAARRPPPAYQPSLMSVVRYDTFLENSSESASRQTNYTAGVVWQPVKYLRCQLNYTYEDYASRAAANRNVVSLMLSGIF